MDLASCVEGVAERVRVFCASAILLFLLACGVGVSMYGWSNDCPSSLMAAAGVGLDPDAGGQALCDNVVPMKPKSRGSENSLGVAAKT